MGDDKELRALCGHQLRAHVAYQDGAHSEAPALVFADADYESGDGNVGLWSDGKSANEPAIVYVRADALMTANARIADLESERDLLSSTLADERDKLTEFAKEILKMEAENARLREALADLQVKERLYRAAHDLHGDGDMRAGRAWDQMRRSGDRARTLLAETALDGEKAND